MPRSAAAIKVQRWGRDVDGLYRWCVILPSAYDGPRKINGFRGMAAHWRYNLTPCARGLRPYPVGRLMVRMRWLAASRAANDETAAHPDKGSGRPFVLTESLNCNAGSMNSMTTAVAKADMGHHPQGNCRASKAKAVCTHLQGLHTLVVLPWRRGANPPCDPTMSY